MMIEEASPPPKSVTDCGHSNLSCAGLCQEHFSMISAAIERNTKLVELVASQVVHPQRTTATMSARGGDLCLDESTPIPRRKGCKFRAPAKKTIHKEDDELHAWVCFISSTGFGCTYTGTIGTCS